MYNFSDYDFIDLGTKNGGSIEFAKKKLGGKKGLGIDLNNLNVIAARKSGYDCLKGDATNLDFIENSFSFIVMSHFLEHLSDLDTIEKVIKNSAEIAKDFLYIQGPFFDADRYLKHLGLKLYWADWHGHPTHLTTIDLVEMLKKNGLNKYIFRVRNPITNSLNPAIHPIASPQDQHEYDYGMHPPKAFINFKKPVFKEMICYVPLRNMSNWNKIRQAKKGLMRYFKNPVMLNPLMRILNKRIIAPLPF